ncbi:MAG: aminotransferase class III-fold pyridoxal phosphate-dependent enzyme, partial [Selenomonadaceae bacterium]
ENAVIRGTQLYEGLILLQKQHPIIGDIRGIGLMRGAEFVHADKSPAPKELDIILEEMKDRGFIIGKNGINRNVMAFQPPLVITKKDINDILTTLEDVLKKFNY